MLRSQCSWAVAVNYYIICYIFILLTLSISLLLTTQNLNLSWSSNGHLSKGPRILLFLSLVALTGLPPMFTLAPKIHLLAFIISNSSTAGIFLVFSLILLGWFVYFTALRSFTQNNINIQNTSNYHVSTTKVYLVCAVLLILVVIAPFFTDDIILWVYYSFGK